MSKKKWSIIWFCEHCTEIEGKKVMVTSSDFEAILVASYCNECQLVTQKFTTQEMDAMVAQNARENGQVSK